MTPPPPSSEEFMETNTSICSFSCVGAGALEICSGFEKTFEWTTDTKTRRRKMLMLHFKRSAEFLSMGVTMHQPAVNDNYLELLEFEHRCLFERDSRWHKWDLCCHENNQRLLADLSPTCAIQSLLCPWNVLVCTVSHSRLLMFKRESCIFSHQLTWLSWGHINKHEIISFAPLHSWIKQSSWMFFFFL